MPVTTYSRAGQWGPTTLIDMSGRPRPGTIVAVYRPDGATLATLYTGVLKEATAANPVTADARASVTLFANPGPYVLRATFAGVVREYAIEVPVDPVEAALDEDVVATADALTAETARATAAEALKVSEADMASFIAGYLAGGTDLYPDIAVAMTVDEPPGNWLVGDYVRDSSGRLTSATVFFPSDGTFGTYTVDAFNATFTNAVDAYHVDKGNPTVISYTQAAVDRDAVSGAVTYRPPISIGFPPAAYDFTVDEQLLADFDADSLGADGTAISAWTPSLGTLSTAASQAVGANRPAVKASALNSHKSALFSGGQFLSTGAYAAPPVQPLTMATVWKASAVGATQWVRSGLSSTGGTLELSLTTGGTLQIKAGTGGTVGAAGTSFDVWHISVAVYNGANSLLYRDARTAVATGTLQSGDLPSSLGATRFGRSTTSAVGYLTGEVARHVVVGRALHTSEVTDLLEQLAAAYDLTIGA